MAKEDYYTIKTKANLYVALVSILTIGLTVISPELIELLAPEEYWEGKYVVVPVILSVYFSFLYTLPVGIEYFHKKTNYIAIGTGAAALLNIILNLIFIQKYGYMAAAYTTVFSYICYFVFHMIIAYRIQKSCIYDLRILLFFILIVFLMSILCIVYIENTLVRYIILMILIVCILVRYTRKKYNCNN